MIQLRPSGARGRSQLEWLESRHTFSFAEYFDRALMGFGPLRVLNEDWIAPGAGFAPHPHRDMEILTYPLEGVLEHRDSRGHSSLLTPGRVQLMRAGSGIVHSEMNPSPDRTVHLLQIWIQPDRRGLEPGYWELDVELKPGMVTPLVSPGGSAGGLAIQQDASVYALRLEPGQESTHPLGPGRRAFLHWARGAGRLAGEPLSAGDAAAVSSRSSLELASDLDSELLIFDLP